MEEVRQEEKPFLTYAQQIAKLYEKQMVIEDEEYAIGLLKKYSYFGLISGYKKPFKSKSGLYKDHVSIDDIYALYTFDDSLRNLLLQYILKIENHIKSLMSYSFCQENGAEQQHYLNATKYNYKSETQEDINELIRRLTAICQNPVNYSYIAHQKKNHQNIPLWVLMKALTIGTVSKMYSFLPQKIQASISKEFPFVDEGRLVQMLDLVARVRNVCAHNERLYDYRYHKGDIDDTAVHRNLGIHRKKGRYIKGKRDLFAVIIVFKYLLDEKDFEAFIKALQELLDRLFSQTSILQKTQMYKYMGFPENWHDISTCSREY